MTLLVDSALECTRTTYLMMGRTEDELSRDRRMVKARAYIARQIAQGERDLERLSVNALKFLVSLEINRPALRAAPMHASLAKQPNPSRISPPE